MNSTHTPGTWDVSFGRNDAAIHAGGTIAMIDDVMTGWRANARLIAAAPDLLAALIELQQMVEAGESNEGTHAVVRAAIAKAVTL